MNESEFEPLAPLCPFCGDKTLETPKPALQGYFQVFTCKTCESEVRKKLSRPAVQVTSHSFKPQGVECPDCAFGDVHCTTCDDTICPRHARTFEQYKPFLDPDLAKDLVSHFGSGVYCPLCFQTALQRQSLNKAKDHHKPASMRQFTVGVFLLILLVLTMMMSKSCPSGLRARQTGKPTLKATAKPTIQAANLFRVQPSSFSLHPLAFTL